MTDIDWSVEYVQGNAGAFHGREIPPEPQPSVWWFSVDQPALVLGSAQPIAHVDVAGCSRAGIEIIRRRSGGGAVLLDPHGVVWVDVVIPTNHHRWTNDVSSSAWWLGDVWLSTLADLGVVDAAVHRSSLVSTRWSQMVCFAGIGGGEVFTTVLDSSGSATTSKIVGISQRRTRSAARFQCALYTKWQPEAHVGLFAEPAPSADDLRWVTSPVDATIGQIQAAFMSNITR